MLKVSDARPAVVKNQEFVLSDKTLFNRVVGECGHEANLVPTPDMNPIPYIFRLRDGIGQKNQEICGKVLTLYICHFSLFTRRFWPNHWAERGPSAVLNFSLVMRRSRVRFPQAARVGPLEAARNVP